MIKKIIRSVVVKVPSLFGYDVLFSRKGKQELIVIDKNIWESYWAKNARISLYFEGLKKSKNEWSDNYYKQLRFYSLQQMVEYCLKQKLEGDFAECGVWKGHSAFIISTILSQNGFSGEFHIFDSFEGGLSEKKDKDKNLIHELSEKRIKEESDVFSSTEEEVNACLKGFKFYSLHKGWIPSRFNSVENRKFQFVHIDVDLYEPTRESLNFFYSRLVENGVIVCDDYGLTQFPGAKRAVDEFLQENKCKMFYEVPMGGCFIIK